MDRNVYVRQAHALTAVALRKESVDRNLTGTPDSGPLGTSLSARRAWIEIGIDFVEEFLDAGSLSARRAWIEIL